MENLLNKIDDLVDTIKSSDEYKRYLELEDKVKNNKEIMSLINEVKDIEKSIVNSKSKKDTESLKKELDNKLTKLEGYPLYNEYIELQEEFNNLFGTIKDKLNNYFEDKIS